MQEMTKFERDMIYVLAGLDEPKGLAVKEELELYYNETVNHGRLYPNLDGLVEDGYVNKGEIDKRTNKYVLTEKGERAIERRETWQEKKTGQ